jgi:5-methylcytosine-specific restriction endonuclease McrA
VPYTLAQIAERDGYRCHLPECGKKVNMALPGSHPMGPTIDHLVPIAAGGLDCLTNVRLAHRSCNCRRQDGGMIQLLLVG